MSDRICLAFAVFSLLGSPAIAQRNAQKEPCALAGTWALRLPNPEVIQFPDVKSQTIVIACAGDSVEISATTNGEESVVELTADGQHRTRQDVPPMSKGEVVSARWDGTALTVIITGGTWVSGVRQITERWSISPDGHTLRRSWSEPSSTLAMIYDKRTDD